MAHSILKIEKLNTVRYNRGMRNLFTFLIAGTLLAAILVPVFAAAENLIPCGEPGNPCDLCDVFQLGTNILNFFLLPTSFNHYAAIVPLIGAFFLVFGGFSYIIAGGNPQGVTRATTILTTTVIGLIIVYASWLFVNTIFQALGVSQWAGLGNWWQLQCN